MVIKEMVLTGLFGLMLSTLAVAEEANETDWAVTAYGAVLSSEGIEDVLALSADYDDDYRLAAIALSRGIDEEFQNIDLEWEAQLVKHVSGQDHWEVNGLVVGRWLPFPWDSTVDTSLAFGAGLSYATDLPEFEQANQDNANELLAYLMLELELKPPGSEHWSLVVRVHHRSGAYGLFDDVEGASNALGVGFKYRFK